MMSAQLHHNDQPVIRRRITFYGRVQAVGFRWRAREAARLYGATGWVGNDPFGSVTMEIQGTEQQIGQVIAALQRGAYIRIDHMKSKDLPLEKNEHSFFTAY